MTMHADSIREDESEPGVEADFLDEDAAEDAFLSTLRPDDKSKAGDEDGDDEPSAETGAEEKSNTEEAPQDEPSAEPSMAGDDAVVVVKVGDEDLKVPVKDLKRLYGQEAALTRRSQEVAQARDQARERTDRAEAVLKAAIERAEKRFEPYAKMNFLALAKNPNIDADTLTTLQEEARAAFEELEFFKTEAGAVRKAAQEMDQEKAREEATKAIQTLEADFPTSFGEKWSPETYQSLLKFAEDNGLPGARASRDPAVFKLLRMAQLYAAGKKVAAEKVKKVAEQPKRPVRPAAAGRTSPNSRNDDAMGRLRRSGSADDAEAAFMARLRRREDD